MAKTRGVDTKLSRLRALGDEKAGPEVIAELRKALGDASDLVVAKAAEIVGARVWPELAPDLAAAFDSFLDEPKKTDKRCRARIAIVESLNKIDYQQEDVFLKGIKQFQATLGWDGTQEDVAAALRGHSAFGLVRIDYPQVMYLLTDLLADPVSVARIAAVQALGSMGASAATPLLRYKARVGDGDPAVTAECLSSLIRVASIESFPFVTEFLRAVDETIQQGAAFALAESRCPEALVILKDHWPRARHGSMAEVILLAISMLRLPAALDFLLEILNGENQSAALAALSALTIHRHNQTLKERIAAIVSKKDEVFRAKFQQKFDAKQ